MQWNLTFCFRWVLWLGLLWLGCCGITVEASTIRLVNGSATNQLYLTNAVGAVWIPPGQQLNWDAIDGELVEYGRDGQVLGNWQHSDTTDYEVLLSDAGVTVFDRSSFVTRWWFIGFVLGFVAEFSGIGARWVRNIIAGGYNE